MKKLRKAVFIMLAVSLMAGCGMEGQTAPGQGSATASTDKDDGSGSASSDVERESDDTASNAENGPVRPSEPFTPVGIPEASGTVVEENDSVVIDYSNTMEGYVMVEFAEDTGNLLKVQVEGPSTTYTYNLEAGEWTTFPLSDGEGNYKVTVYESMDNAKYATVLSASFQVTLESEFAPFLHANQYVNYCNATDTMVKTAELTGGTTNTLEKVGNIYNYVIKNVTYDTQKAAGIQSGYLPVLDDVLASKKGICFDYAALMAGMLRSCGIPCKLIVGYSGDVYHAWISVWTDEAGWLDDIIYFDGESWQRMDPTFASANGGSDAVMEYIGDGDNYTPQYQY